MLSFKVLGDGCRFRKVRWQNGTAAVQFPIAFSRESSETEQLSEWLTIRQPPPTSSVFDCPSGMRITHQPYRRLHPTDHGGRLMKAAVVPAMNSSWQIEDVPQPQPGPGQVLVKMRASGICYTDVHETLGHIPGQFPRILGHEPVGEIVAVAPGVTTRKAGDRVGTAWIQSTCGRCEWCQRGRRMFLSLSEGHGARCTRRPCRVHVDECRRHLFDS